jgi:hypothetical protein
MQLYMSDDLIRNGPWGVPNRPEKGSIMARDMLDEDVGQFVDDDSIAAGPGMANRWGRDVSVEKLLLNRGRRGPLNLLRSARTRGTLPRKGNRKSESDSQEYGHHQECRALHSGYLRNPILARVTREVNSKRA